MSCTGDYTHSCGSSASVGMVGAVITPASRTLNACDERHFASALRTVGRLVVSQPAMAAASSS